MNLKTFNPIIFFLLIATAPISAQDMPDMQAIFRDLTRLEGVWFMPTDRGDRLEFWNWENDSTMIGRGCRIKPETGDTATLENLKLELRGDAIVYYAKVRGQNEGKFIAFTLTEAENDTYLFENPAHDDPKKIKYFLLEGRELQVNTEGTRNGRPTKQEFIFEREFNPASLEFRVRVGANAHQLYKINDIGVVPTFSARPGWELGITTAFKGSGGLVSFNIDAGLIGKFHHVKSNFTIPVDTLPFTADYVRDLTYNQTWFSLGLMPEVKLRRKGKTSIVFGGYYARLLINKVKGTEKPVRNVKVFNFNNDFKKSDFGAVVGLNYQYNIGKKKLDGVFGLRAQFGLADIDNLYIRKCESGGLCNGRLGIAGVSLSYSFNLLKL
jgi:Domain of unknown function (DUF6265)/Outer membrane protein beta-barrel domain